MATVPHVDDLPEIIDHLAAWPVQPERAALRVGDLGWNQQFGAAALAAALRVWWDDGAPAAVGLLDAPDLLRLVVAPQRRHDDALVDRIVRDIEAADGGVLPAGEAWVEARFDGPLNASLVDRGWVPDEPWTPLVRDLAGPVPDHHLRIEDVEPGRLDDRISVHHSAFERSTFTVDRWSAMAAGHAYSRARSLVGYDQADRAVAMVTVWTTGSGGPGELEPMGVHRDHAGNGHGRAICLAAASSLKDLGASHAFVSTPSSNVAAVATYRAAGYTEQPAVRDLRRPPGV